MKRMMVGLLAVAIVFGAAGVRAADASRTAQAEELLNILNMRENIEKSFAMVKQMMPQQIANAQSAAGVKDVPTNVTSQTEKMMDAMMKEFSWDNIKGDYIALYAETFTEKELKDLIAFYKSPAGQAFVAKQPELMKRSMELSQKVMMKVMPKIQTMAQEIGKSAAEAAVQKKDAK